MSLSEEDLRKVVRELSTKPGHEKVRALIHDLLVHALGMPSESITYEQRVVEVRGRLDAILGATVFEFKRDLAVEMGAVLAKMPGYLSDRERENGRRFVGIATDGSRFVPFRLDGGNLVSLTPYETKKDDPRGLIDWLGRVVLVQTALKATAENVRNELGRDSLAYEVARTDISAQWEILSTNSEAILKRDLWANLLERVYGSAIAGDQLFFQHTFLVVVAKAVAAQMLGIGDISPIELLSGKPFADAGIVGAVDSDFFDWILLSENGRSIVQAITAQVSRFDLSHVEIDFFKDLYESLIDPEQRHDLGEYYTPDWLAVKLCRKVITSPLFQRVLDPSCGSGTFLFHAVRQLLAASDVAGLPNEDAVHLATTLVVGIDIHPVAVIIARVVFLLAIGEKRLQRRGPISIPVYLGDSLQWNADEMFDAKTVRIDVPQGPSLYFPASITADPGLFDQMINALIKLSEQGAGPSSFAEYLDGFGIKDASDKETLVNTYTHIRQLQVDERDHIWGYVARNCARPIWLSLQEQKADVLIGNPPWLQYRAMSRPMQLRFKDDCKRLGLWGGGQGSTGPSDLSGDFVVKSVELYAKVGAALAFVMPLAALSRKQFRSFFAGEYRSTHRALKNAIVITRARICFKELWALSDKVRPLFNIPACVVFAEAGATCTLPTKITDYSGFLPRRNASVAEAETALTTRTLPWSLDAPVLSGYANEFRAGAIVYPSLFFRVGRSAAGKLGGNPAIPVVESLRNPLEKNPWRKLERLRGPVETPYLRNLYVGESIAPFRILEPILAVVPWHVETSQLLQAEAAQRYGALNLAKWLANVDALWKKHSKQDSGDIVPRLDYFGQLRAQFPIASHRLVYTASGTRLSAAILNDLEGLVEHKSYWYPVTVLAEGRYLEAVLNSEEVRSRIERFQSRGLWGPRDFDKVVFKLDLPAFDSLNESHLQLATLADAAGSIARSVDVSAVRLPAEAKRLVRSALERSGIFREIDDVVRGLLPPVLS